LIGIFNFITADARKAQGIRLENGVQCGQTFHQPKLIGKCQMNVTQRTSNLVANDHSLSDIDAQYRDAPSDKPWVAPELRDQLFVRGWNTFFVVDATLRTNVVGYFDLDEGELPAKCLFTGEAARKFRETAPYILDMTLPDASWDDPSQVPEAHRDFFKRHWSKGTGFFIRTQADLNTVWANFRKFTKVLRGDGKVTYFRFWDTSMLMYFLEACSDKELDRFFVTPDDVFCVGRPSKFDGKVTTTTAWRGKLEKTYV